MNEYVDKNFDESKKKVEITFSNGCSIKYQIKDETNDSGSQELFSDDEEVKGSTILTPPVAKNNATVNSSNISLNTPILWSKLDKETPGKAFIPRTPRDLLPFITKTNVLWTSDMETPEHKLNEIFERSNETVNSIDNNNKKTHCEENTPKYENMKTHKMDTTSPVLGGKKRSNRRVKRRLLNNVAIDFDNNNDQLSSISSNSDKLPSETASTISNEFALDIEPEKNKATIEEYNNLTSTEFKENKNLKVYNNFDKNSNTSTQDFFSNASFSSIDRLCSSVIQEEKVQLTDEEDKTSKNEKNEIFNEECELTNVSNNILERVAAIKRVQKSVKRSINVNAVIPKDAFSKSLRELELADLKFTQEKCKTLKQASFTKFKSADNDSIKSNKFSIVKNEMDSFSQFVPAEIMDDWNADAVLKNQKDNVNLKSSSDSSNNPTLINTDDNFCTANGKGIIINEENLRKSEKLYKEIENELKNSNDIFNVKKSNTKLTSTKQIMNKTRYGKNSLNPLDNLPCSNKLQLTNLDNNFNDTTDKLSVNNKNNILNKNKTLNEAVENKHLNGLKNDKDKSNNSKFNSLQCGTPNTKLDINIKIKENEVSQFHEKKYNQEEKLKQDFPADKFLESKCILEDIDDNGGFTTAGGKDIQINEEKESYYSEVFNKLSETIQDEKSFLNLKKFDLSKTNHINKSLNKAAIIFNNKPKDLIAEAKLNISNNTNANYFNLDNLEKSNTLANCNILKNRESNNRYCFTVPNSTNILKRTNQTSTIIQNEPRNSLKTTQNETNVKKENVYKNEQELTCAKNYANSTKNLEKVNILDDDNTYKNKQYEGQIEKLKQKLQNCETKRPERCRSFGGFAVNDQDVSITKLNKSDPVDESFINQPLKNGLSISQCFDSHSDSWLSKVEISHLNTSKVKTPNLRNIKVELNYVPDKSSEFLGFSFKECTENFRRYASFKKFLTKLIAKYNNKVELNVDSKESITLCCPIALKEQTLVKCEENVEVNENMKESNDILIEPKPDTNTNELIHNHESEVKQNNSTMENVEKVIEKRKHIDTDSDTPLSTLKKPRVGSKLQARKLFCDESNDEDNYFHTVKKVKKQKKLPSLNIPVLTDQDKKDLLEKRIHAVLHQEKIIRNKKRMKINITMGNLLRQRLRNTKKRISWTKFVNDSVPMARSIEQIKQNHPDAKILEVTASNATCYKFLSANIIKNKKVVGLDLDDGATLIFDENGHAGVSEFTKAFLAMPGVDPKLLPMGWVENHYRWIVWKLASMDRISFNTINLPKMLTPERIINELKYRYDREIDKAERPALRRILEKDDVPTKRLVLCISSIKNASEQEEEKNAQTIVDLSQLTIEATDGWYSVPLMIDNAMANYVAIGKIKEGTKIVTYGAELLECQKGYFPLEKPANVSLKIYTNCTRRARWNTKLGYQKNSQPIPVKLRDILAGGGMIGETTAVVARTYPLLYREKTTNGQSIYRNARAEEKAANTYEQSLQLKVDAMYAEAEKNFDSKKTSESDEEAPCRSKETRSDENDWHRKQDSLKQKFESRMRQDLPPPRQVTAVQKIRLVHDETSVILSVWGASEDSGYDIKEGDIITVYNFFAMGTRGGELNLTANRMTHIKKEPLLKLPYPIRTCTPIPDIGSSSFKPMFNEFDIVGVVLSSGAAPYGMKNFEAVNIAHPKPNNSGSSYLSILFWNGVSSFGYQGMLSVGSLVACSNLEWRRNASWSVPVAYCSKKTVFTCNPRQTHLVKELRILKALVQNPISYAKACAEEISVELSKKSQSRVCQGTPGGWPSSWTQTPSSELRSPGGPSVQRRLEMLSHYGCPSDSSPSVVLNDSSDRVNKDFTPVTRNNT